MSSVRSNNLSLKCHRFTPSDCKDVGISKFLVCCKNSVSYEGSEFLPRKMKFPMLSIINLSIEEVSRRPEMFLISNM